MGLVGRPRHPGTRVIILCCPEPTGTEDSEPLGSSSRAGARGRACEGKAHVWALTAHRAATCWWKVGKQKHLLLDRLSRAAVYP